MTAPVAGPELIPTRLPFVLEDWTRLIWTSARAKEVWQERINNINAAWERIERWAVVDGARHSALTFFQPSYLPEATRWATSHGLVLLPLAQVGVSDQYSATPKPVEGNRWQYRAVLTRAGLAKQWIEAWQDTGKEGKYRGTDNQRLGRLLGYPACCIDFFERTWVQAGCVDTTWVSAMDTPEVRSVDVHTCQVHGPPEANILLRWLGVRLVAHLPCSFQCAATVEMARRFVEVARKRQFGEWVDYVYEMLDWPVEWSALHGIAEVRTPIVTISTRTDATGAKLTVRRDGARYPAEGANGLQFPFRIVTGQVTDKPAFRRPFATPVHERNGFASAKGMQQAHDEVLRTLPPGHIGGLLDLGCGSGRLLERAREELAWTEVHGVELDAARAEVDTATVPITVGSLFDLTCWDRKYDTVLFMPGRLLESGVTPDMARAVLRALRERAQEVVCYAYGDWAERCGGDLRTLCQSAGFADATWTFTPGQSIPGAVLTGTLRPIMQREALHAITAEQDLIHHGG